MFKLKTFISRVNSFNKYFNDLNKRFISKKILNNNNKFLSKPSLRVTSNKNEIGSLGWFLLLIPTSTFGLGTWQVQRKKWKENLIAELNNRSNSKPISLPENLSELKDLEYYPVYVRGKFLHDKELYIGPRSLLLHGDASTQGGLMSKNQSSNSGYLVITPFQLSDRDQTILINRGWVPTNKKNPKARQEGQIQGEVELIGIVRLKENRPTFIPKNNPEANSWFYRDLDAMAKVTNAEPVFLDATTDFEVANGPKAGQTRISLRNEHLSYILTWYSLSGFTSYMWYRQFLQKMPLI